MDATTLLKNDHALLKDLFRRYHEMTPGESAEKKALFREIKDELGAHSSVEEELFYPAVRDARTPDAERLVAEAFEEHRLVKQLLRKLSKGRPGSTSFDATFKVLKENVLHHAQEEERDIFVQAWDTMSSSDLDALGREMAERKHELGGRLHQPKRLMAKAKRAFTKVKRAVTATFSRSRRSGGQRTGRSESAARRR